MQNGLRPSARSLVFAVDAGDALPQRGELLSKVGH
jgi:hypothetical protein